MVAATSELNVTGVKEEKKDEMKGNRGAPLRRTYTIKEKDLFIEMIKG